MLSGNPFKNTTVAATQLRIIATCQLFILFIKMISFTIYFTAGVFIYHKGLLQHKIHFLQRLPYPLPLIYNLPRFLSFLH